MAPPAVGCDQAEQEEAEMRAESSRCEGARGDGSEHELRGARTPRAATTLAMVLIASLACWIGPGSASAEPSLENPPPGANDWSCKPSAAHPEPVVLVHGLSATMGLNWSYVSPLLAERGYCVFALTYGIDPRTVAIGGPGGVIPIEESAKELDAFVDRVLEATGAERIDLVGHSEGTYMPQFWLKFDGGSQVTDDYVAMTPLYDGTTLYATDQVRDLGAQFGLAQAIIDSVAAACGSCPQFIAGSPMQRKLTEGGAAAAQVDYTTIPTRLDELVTPWSSGLIQGPGTDNQVLQEVCPSNTSEHLAVAFDPAVAQLIFNALDPPDARPVDCNGLPPFDGRQATVSGTGVAELAVLGKRLKFSSGDSRPKCVLGGEAERGLASCKIVVRTSKRRGGKLLAYGRAAADHQTEFEQAPRRGFKVDLKLTRRGFRLINGRGAGPPRGRLVARARDDLDRPVTVRKGVRLRRG